MIEGHMACNKLLPLISNILFQNNSGKKQKGMTNPCSFRKWLLNTEAECEVVEKCNCGSEPG